MDVKVVLLCVEAPLLILLLVEIIVACALSSKRRNENDNSDNVKSFKGGAAKDEVKGNTNEQTVNSVAEPEGYVKGADRFLDRLTSEERAEFYKTFINAKRCGLQYKVGGDNAEFFSGVFIYLGGVRYVISDGLMRKICVEYDRLRGLPVTAGLK